MSGDVFETFRAGAATLDADRDARIRQRLAELTRGERDRDGASPFQDEPVVVIAPVRPLRRRRTEPWRWVAAAAAVVTVVATGAVVTTRLRPEPGQVAAGVGDEAVGALAARAGARPPLVLGPGEVLHQRWEAGAPAGNGEGVVTVAGETWLAADGTGREVRTDEVVTSPGGGSQVVLPGSDVAFDVPASLGLDEFGIAELLARPADRDAFVSGLAQGRGHGADDAGLQFDVIARFLTVPLVAPELRAAAFHALDRLGGAPLGSVVDRHGRAAVGVAGPGVGGGRTLVVVDPVTTEVWEVRTGAGPGVPTVADATGWRVVVAQGVTSARGDAPAG